MDLTSWNLELWKASTFSNTYCYNPLVNWELSLLTYDVVLPPTVVYI